MKIDKKILIGAGVLVVGYLLYTKSEKDKLKKRIKSMEDKRKLWEA
jgi:hypothetical protein